MKALLSQLRPALAATVVLALVTCGVYPLLVTAIARTAFKEKADGSLITDGEGKVIGSTLLGQAFTADQYFHPRPSAAGAGYDAASSGGSNLGPASQKLNDQITERIALYREKNGLKATDEIPADAVTASASGLDPHISERNARLQAPRIAKARLIGVEKVQSLITKNLEKPDFGIFGESRVNVLRLNQALDSLK